MNYTDKLRDRNELAHELGHGVHSIYRARSLPACYAATPRRWQRFRRDAHFPPAKELFPEPRTRLAMLCSKIEDAFATVFDRSC